MGPWADAFERRGALFLWEVPQPTRSHMEGPVPSACLTHAQIRPQCCGGAACTLCVPSSMLGVAGSRPIRRPNHF